MNLSPMDCVSSVYKKSILFNNYWLTCVSCVYKKSISFHNYWLTCVSSVYKKSISFHNYWLICFPLVCIRNLLFHNYYFDHLKKGSNNVWFGERDIVNDIAYGPLADIWRSRSVNTKKGWEKARVRALDIFLASRACARPLDTQVFFKIEPIFSRFKPLSGLKNKLFVSCNPTQTSFYSKKSPP